MAERATATTTGGRRDDFVSEPTTDLGWLQLQTRALYRHDEAGRLVGMNAFPEDDQRVPRLFVGIAREALTWRMRADLPASLVSEVARLLGAERPPRGAEAGFDLDREPERMAVVRARLEEHAPIEREWRGPAYRFGEVEAAAGEDVVEIADAARASHFPIIAGQLAQRAPVFGVLAGGEVVSLAYCATPPGPAGGPVEVGVETAPAHRGRGHAARAVGAWASAIRSGGRLPLYSTSFDDRSSRAVARKLGAIRFGTDLHLR